MPVLMEEHTDLVENQIVGNLLDWRLRGYSNAPNKVQ